MSGVLGTAKHFLTAVGSLPKYKREEEFDGHKYISFYRWKSLGVSQLLLMGSMSKRQKMLGKTSIFEPHKDTLVFPSSKGQII